MFYISMLYKTLLILTLAALTSTQNTSIIHTNQYNAHLVSTGCSESLHINIFYVRALMKLTCAGSADTVQ